MPLEPVKAAPSRSSSSRSMRDMHASPRPKAAAPATVAVSKKNVTISRGKKTRPETREPLKKRRKKTQKAALIVFGVLSLVLVGMLFYVAWLPALRITSVAATGPHAEEAETLARQSIQGTHAFVLPRNSLFFVPESDIRASILRAHPDIEAVSISAAGLTTLTIRTLPRPEAFVWCGVAPEVREPTCYSANAEGLIFAPVSLERASTTPALSIFAPVEGREGESPIKARIGYASRIPEVLRFVKAMQSLGADVVSLTIRGDEADLVTRAGTRLTYVLGREQEAAGVAASVFPQLALNDGSILYVDLRFSGKAYFKRAGEPAATEE